MKIHLLIFAFLVVAHGELNQWVWYGGSSSTGQNGVYGSKGVPSPNNIPGARQGHTGLVHPSSGRFILFGGNIQDPSVSNSQPASMNDLWSFDFSTNQWTWLSGSNSANQGGSYGSKGVAANSNVPRSRYHHAMDINPASGNLIVFGGVYNTNNFMNDLWEFDFEKNQWTWLSGSSSTNQEGNYGVRGISQLTTFPGARARHVINIHPTVSKLFLFGGDSPDGVLNDLWSYNMNTKDWTWVDGSNSVNQAGVYSSKGSYSSSSVPGSRMGHSSAINPTTGVLMIYGGVNPNYLNDLWFYNPTSNQWAWMSGSNSPGQTGNYGSKGVASASNVPGARYGHNLVFVPFLNSLILFGGDRSGTVGGDYFNDLWQFSLTTNQWTWISGSSSVNQVGNYGTKGVSANTNAPSARRYASLDYTASTGRIILWGGMGTFSSSDYGCFNDMWLYDIHAPIILTTSRPQSSSTSRIPVATSSSLLPSSSSLISPSRSSSSSSLSPPSLSRSVVSSSRGSLSASTAQFPSSSSKTISSEKASSTSNDALPSSSPTSSSWIQTFPSSTKVTALPLESSLSHDNEKPTMSLSESLLSASTATEMNMSSSTLKTTLSSRNLLVNKTSNPRSNMLDGNVKFIIIAALTIFIVLLFLLVCKVARTNGKKHLTQIEISEKGSLGESHSTNSSNSLPSMMSGTTVSSGSSGGNTNFSFSDTATRFNANPGLSLPGFLRFNADQDYVIGRKIASGGFATVCLAEAINPQLTKFGKTIIVKLCSSSTISQKEIDLFHQEVSIMYFLKDCKNIATFLGYSESPYGLLMKHYELGTLDKWIQISKRKTKRQILFFMTDICNGLECMHRSDFAHCDLKPQNILLDYDKAMRRMFCVITDFGITQIISDKNLLVDQFKAVNFRGASMLYASPEAILRVRKKQEIVGKGFVRSDIYALGTMLYEIITMNKPWLDK